MKTQFIIPALLFLGMASAPVFANTNVAEKEAIQITVQEKDKVKVDPENLPVLVKETIAEDTETANLTITEAWQNTDKEGAIYYKVKFDKAGEEWVKKYDANGKEIKETTSR